MKKMKLFCNKLCILFLLSTCLVSCFKPKYSYEYIDQETKDYCIFKEGSYWIYQDSVTNNTDSVILTRALLKWEERGHHNMTEYYDREYWHYFSDTSIRLYSFMHPLRFPVIIFNSGIDYYEKFITIPHPEPIFLSSISIPYTVGENIFNNVKISKVQDPFGENYRAQFYWVKHIGIIRYEIYNFNNEILNTYNLIRYNVKPYKP